MKDLQIKLDNGNYIVASFNDWSYQGEKHQEICITIQNSEGIVIQDLALVRPKDGFINVAEVLVWADKDDEDYTNKFRIGQYYEED